MGSIIIMATSSGTWSTGAAALVGYDVAFPGVRALYSTEFCLSVIWRLVSCLASDSIPKSSGLTLFGVANDQVRYVI